MRRGCGVQTAGEGLHGQLLVIEMFYYFGAKGKMIDCYPPAVHRTVIEPFCGSARYACKYWKRDVWINDKYEVVYKIWKWIQGASKSDVDAIPVMKAGDKLSDLDLNESVKHLLSLTINPGADSPRNQMTDFGDGSKFGQTNRIVMLKMHLRRLVGRIDHWRITNLDYGDMDVDRPATWFIDPPYQKQGTMYAEDVDDYGRLREWVLSRTGQVIVCEQDGADWLPFRKLIQFKGTVRGSQYWEMIYHRCDKQIGFGFEQQKTGGC